MRGSEIPWLTDDIRQEMFKRDHLRKKASSTKDQEAHSRFRTQRNYTHKCILNAKREYYDSLIQESVNDSKTLWSSLKSMLPKKATTVTQSVLTADGAETKEPLEVANAFNSFFTSVGATLAKKFQDVPRTISTRSENRFKFQPVSAEAVCKQLRGLKTSKAHGVDGIPARLLKVAARELALPIATIFNYSLSTGTIPAEWKQARVTPIFKEGDKQDTSNYRPISVLPLCMKVFERIVHNQFHTHITTNNLLNPNQSGFRPKHSTTTALIDVTDYLYNQSQNGLITGAIFLDLKKAFDTVNPVILQEKLRAIGVHGTELQWFDNYFTNRTQVVSANGAVSTTQPISCGVPQGSILGPLLFTLYVNDLSSVAVHSKVVLYADDTAIFVSGKNIEDIQGKLSSDLERISAWLYANKLTLNANKTKTMLFGTNQRLARLDTELSVTAGDIELEQVPCFKYLGLHFDPVLNWKQHTEFISKKISQRIGVLKRTRNCLTTDTANLLYKSLILPIISYGDTVWSKGVKANLVRLQRLQNRAGRVVLRCDTRTHIVDIHSQLKWPLCQVSINLHKCLLVGKCLYGAVPQYLQGIFQRVDSVHNHGTRRADAGLFVPRANSTAAKNMFAYEGAVLYNGLPMVLKSADNFIDFKRNCNSHFKNMYDLSG